MEEPNGLIIWYFSSTNTTRNNWTQRHKGKKKKIYGAPEIDAKQKNIKCATVCKNILKGKWGDVKLLLIKRNKINSLRKKYLKGKMLWRKIVITECKYSDKYKECSTAL